MVGPFDSEVVEINKLLLEHFGKEDGGRAIFRIVWSENEWEKQLTKYTAEGLELLSPEVREVPKYRQWIHNKYILERLVAVPFQNEKQLITKVSYEPLHVFENGAGNPLPPRFDIAKLVIDCLYEALGKEYIKPKYIDNGETYEEKEARLAKLQDELFGNETEVGDALAHKQAIVVPHNFDKAVH